MTPIREKLPALLLGALLALAAVACDESAVDVEGDPIPAGLTVTVNGHPSVTVSGAASTGRLSVATGERASLEVVFVDGLGAPFSTAGLSMGLEVLRSDVATFRSASPGAFAGELSGVHQGSTTLRISLLRGSGGSGAPMYISPPVEVVVTPP